MGSDGRSDQWLALVTAVERLAGAADLEAVIAIVRETARAVSGADGVTFVLKDGDFCHYVDEDAIAPLWKGRRFPLTACISGWCMLNRRVAAIPDIYVDPRIPHDAYRPTFVRSLIMTPVGGEDPRAAIGAYWAAGRAFHPDEVLLLEALARSTATALAAVQARAEIRRHAERVGALQSDLARLARSVELDHLGATLAHELNQPLTAIKSYLGAAARIVEGLGPGAERAVELVRKADAQTGRAAQTLQRVREFVGRGETNPRPEPVAELAAEALEIAGLHPKAQGVTIRCELDAGLPLVLADRIQVQQVLLNLLRNAFEAVEVSPQREVVLRACATADGMVELAVSDTGPGLRPEVAGRLFQSFVSGGSGGLGIGLSISRGIVEAHGGRIEAGAAPGGGAAFRFTLPAAAQAGPDQVTEPARASPDG